SFYFFIPTPPPATYTLSLHDALPILRRFLRFSETAARQAGIEPQQHQLLMAVKGLPERLKPTISVLAERMQLQHHSTVELTDRLDRKSTRLNSSHVSISYAVFCLKKK